MNPIVHECTADTESGRDTALRKMLTEAQFLALLPFSRTTLFALVRRGCFPRPSFASPNKRFWFADDIAKWQNAIGELNPHYNPNRGRGKGRHPRKVSDPQETRR